VRKCNRCKKVQARFHTDMGEAWLDVSMTDINWRNILLPPPDSKLISYEDKL
jgi:hypothetical protein